MAMPQWVIDRIPSNEMDPLDALILAEEEDAREAKLAKRRHEALLPNDRHPSQLLMGCPAWPVPPDEHGRCGTCHGLAGGGTFCLCCDTQKGSLVGLVARINAAANEPAKPRTRKEKRRAKERKAA